MKRLKYIIGAIALLALVVVNVWNAATTLRGSELGIADVEAMAQIEEEEFCPFGWANGGPTMWVEVKSSYVREEATCYHYEECRNSDICEAICWPGEPRTWAVKVGID